MESVEELIGFLQTATQDSVWNQLSNRGVAWSTMRSKGILPAYVRNMGDTIENDLEEYGFSVLRAALSLHEKNGDAKLVTDSFEKAGRTFECLITNSSDEMLESSFFRVIAAACYHLGGFSAIAYSIVNIPNNEERNNYSPGEEALVYLLLRNLERLRTHVRHYINLETSNDRFIGSAMDNNEIVLDDAISTILNVSICRGLAFFDFALETGNALLFESAKSILSNAVKLAANYGNVPLWWISKLCLNLIADLWKHSLHQLLPFLPPRGGEEDYEYLRDLFITSLYGRKIAEVELWPSQVEAAKRSVDITDDLVVALPTSAGKTRIAEIAALMTLSTKQRVMIVTPLRALSAQTERSFRETFAPLGFSVSSLYGASGVSAFDRDTLRTRSIVIATPEKLDFALRNDSELLDDVGLIILDEGHMIGRTEREIRYEILVQGLLRRTDASMRRIVCLSAILPDGENLDDFTAWMRKDNPGVPVKKKWRPTRQRFGKIILNDNGSVQLNFDHRTEVPVIRRFLKQIPPEGKDEPLKPGHDVKELTIFSAWKFAEQNKRTLIFVTQANWVEGFGKKAIQLIKQGYLKPLIEDLTPLSRAIAVGKEWLGTSHPAVQALEIGVAIHHGKLPNPFLRELELLLSKGIIKVTAASPTLSQGLNINAAVLLVPYLVRAGQTIKGVEFANVAGRAGRAFVDVEGLVLHVICNDIINRSNDWKKLVDSSRERTLTSGLFYVLNEIYSKLSDKGILERADAYEFLASNRKSWMPAKETEDEKIEDDPEQLIEKLDNIVLGLVEALDADAINLPQMLEDALKGSLWQRQVEKNSPDLKEIHEKILTARANLIWHNSTAAGRRGYFAMGVGLDSGLAIDAIADKLEILLENADISALTGEEDNLSASLISLAEYLFEIDPFKPPENELPENWREILSQWVKGVEIDRIGANYMPIIENVFSYRLVWAFEAVRVRRVSNGWKPEYTTGGASAAIENGLPLLMMSMLVRAGLPSRKAAIIAIHDSGANFNDSVEMQKWLKSDFVEQLTEKSNWPTTATSEIWKEFRKNALNRSHPTWQISYFKNLELDKNSGTVPPPGNYRIEINSKGEAWLFTPDFKSLIMFKKKIKQVYKGIINATIIKGEEFPIVKRYGPGKVSWI